MSNKSDAKTAEFPLLTWVVPITCDLPTMHHFCLFVSKKNHPPTADMVVNRWKIWESLPYADLGFQSRIQWNFGPTSPTRPESLHPRHAGGSGWFAGAELRAPRARWGREAELGQEDPEPERKEKAMGTWGRGHLGLREGGWFW